MQAVQYNIRLMRLDRTQAINHYRKTVDGLQWNCNTLKYTRRLKECALPSEFRAGE